MAFVPLVPQTLNIAPTQGYAQSFLSSPVVNPAGTAVDLSGWVSLAAKLVPSSPNPTGTDVSFGTVTATNAGVITLTMSAADLASVPIGSAKLLITGKPTGGDATQVLATGVCSLLNS